MNKFIINGLVFLIGILALIFKDELVKLYKKFTEKKKSEVEVENNEETPSGRSLWDSLWDITQEIVLISLPFFIALFFVEGHRKAIYVSWIIFFAFSVYEVKAGEVAIKTQFGKIIRGYEKNTGLVLVCWWLRGLKKMSVKIKQFQIPDEPENIYWTDPQSPDFELPGGKSLPIWVNTAGPETADYTLDFDKETKERYNKAQNDAEKKVIIDEVKSLYNGDPLHKRMPIPMDGTFAYRTGTAEDFVLFYINVKTEESLRKLVRDVFERVLNDFLMCGFAITPLNLKS